MEVLQKVARKQRIILIEDSAQGFPVNDYNYDWQGDYTILSFGR